MKRPLMLLFSFLFCAISVPIYAQSPLADVHLLWKHITVESPYTNWSFWDDHQGLQKGGGPHAPQHRVYVNTLGITSKKVPANNGTIIVKENIDDNNTLIALTVMHKVAGYNPAGGDWFWAKYSAAGKIEMAGKIKGCLGCHTSVKENDFIFLHGFSD